MINRYMLYLNGQEKNRLIQANTLSENKDNLMLVGLNKQNVMKFPNRRALNVITLVHWINDKRI